MILESGLIEKLKNEDGYNIHFYDKNANKVDSENCYSFSLCGVINGYISRYEFKANKKVTYDWIIENMQKKDSIVSINWNDIFKKSCISDKFRKCYNTSYGFGIECIFFNNNEVKETISNFLKENEIDFSNEYSEAGWVYRFKISKSKENIKKLLKLK